jgi:WD repeat-containing protein 22
LSHIFSGETLDVFFHEDAVYGISVNPENGNEFATACDDGRILIYDIREPPATGTSISRKLNGF